MAEAIQSQSPRLEFAQNKLHSTGAWIHGLIYPHLTLPAPAFSLVRTQEVWIQVCFEPPAALLLSRTSSAPGAPMGH